MEMIVSLVGILITAVGVVIAVAPKWFVDWMSSLDPGVLFWFGILARVSIGILFLLAAPSCRLPLVVQVVGVFSLIAALTMFVAGQARLASFTTWVLGRPQALIRSWSVVAVGFGMLLIYAGA